MTVFHLKRRCPFSILARHFSNSRNALLKGPWKVLFLGTDEFSLPHLEVLNKNRIESGSAVSQLEATVTTKKCPTYHYARKNDIKLHVWPMGDITDQYDVGVIVSFGRLIPESFIQKFPRGILNVHPSLLPKWRGAAPIQHTILNGDQETAVSIMEISPHQFDVGPLLIQEQYPIMKGATAISLQQELAKHGSRLLLHCLENLDSITKFEQDATINPGPYAKKFSLKHSFVNWEKQGVDDIDRHYRALADMLDIRSVYRETQVRLRKMVEPCNFPRNTLEKVLKNELGPGQPIYLHKEELLCIRCWDGWVGFKEINIKKPMTAKSFYNGYLSKKDNKNVLFQSVENGLDSYFVLNR